MEVLVNVNSDASGVILDFVRGARSWADLETLGARIAFSDDGCSIDGTLYVVRPSLRDIAQGLAHHAAGPAHHLQRWAQVVLAGSGFLDLADLESDPDGEEILNAIWDASAGDPPEEHAVLLARSIARR